jgi:hypothetical protein
MFTASHHDSILPRITARTLVCVLVSGLLLIPPTSREGAASS